MLIETFLNKDKCDLGHASMVNGSIFKIFFEEENVLLYVVKQQSKFIMSFC